MDTLYKDHGLIFPDWREYMKPEYYGEWKSLVEEGKRIEDVFYDCILESIVEDTDINREEFYMRDDAISDDAIVCVYNKYHC